MFLTVNLTVNLKWCLEKPSISSDYECWTQLSGSDGPFDIYRYQSPSIALNRKRSIGVVRHRSKRPSYPSKRSFTIDRRLSRSSRFHDQVHHDAAKSNRATLRVLDVRDAAFLETSDRTIKQPMDHDLAPSKALRISVDSEIPEEPKSNP
jgi:hypothetical protein